MDEKKPSTADILAKIRAQKAATAAPAASAPAAEPPAAEPPAVPVAAEPPVAAAAAPASAAPAPAAAKPAALAAKPSSTKDIMAAIRSQGATGAAKPAAAAPSAPAAATPAAAAPVAAAATVAAAPPKTPAPAGPLPSVAEMVRAARTGASAVAGAATAAAPVAEPKAKPVAPPMPAKPVSAAAAKKAPSPERRALALAILAGVFYVVATPFRLAWTACAVVTGIATLGTARFMFPNVLVEPPSKFKVGPPSDYPLNTVSNKWKDQFGVWIVHTDQYQGKNLIFALQSVCTHLGCTPNWLDGEQKFKCPCHGSGFYITGVNFEGPAPRPLERMGVRVAEDGMLEVDKSMKFQEEMGQWKDATSFVDGELA